MRSLSTLKMKLNDDVHRQLNVFFSFNKCVKFSTFFLSEVEQTAKRDMIILTSLKFINIARYWNHMLQLILFLVPPLNIQLNNPLQFIPISPCHRFK